MEGLEVEVVEEHKRPLAVSQVEPVRYSCMLDFAKEH